MNLEVFSEESLVGRLSFTPAAGFSLQYTESWRTSPKAFDLSPTLPMAAPHEPDGAFTFVLNLLPEGRALDDTARIHRLSKRDVAGLLAAVGAESASGISFVREGGPAPAVSLLRPLGRKELSQRLQERPELPFTAWDADHRCSIAGFQDKLAVRITSADDFFLPGGSGWSTHILKPESTNSAHPFLPANEHFCMKLAEQLKLPVAHVRLLDVPERVLAVRRFDRVRQADGNISRLHQLDGCQALGLPPDYKYEEPFGRSGGRRGATVASLYNLLAQCAAPAVARREFVRWLIFQVLIGNTDAHAKNVAFTVSAEGLRLSPAYDLVCHTVYEGSEKTRLAMSIGDAFELNELKAYPWALFAHELGIPRRLLGIEMSRLAEGALRALNSIDSSGYTSSERFFLMQVRLAIAGQAESLRWVAKEIPKVSESLLE